MDRTPYQENIIKRYYENKPEIMLQKLSELATELYLAETPKKRAQLWKRAALVAKDDPAALVTFIEQNFGKK